MNNWWKRKITNPLTRYLGERKVRKKFKKGPILIGGCGRSGTSLLLAILSAHPRVFALPKETDAFTQWTRDDMGEVYPTRLDRFYRQILLSSVPKSCNRWCEKRPYNVRYIAQILEYFGKRTRFVHIVRDPRAVCTSRHPSKPDQYWIPIDRYIKDLAAGIRFLDHPQVYTVKYEDLILDTQPTIKSLCKFLGVSYSNEMRNWFDHASIRKSKAWYGELLNTHSEALSKWKNPEHKDRVEEISANEEIVALARQLGYSIE